MNAWDIQQVVVSQFHISRRTFHDTFNIDRQYLACQVLSLSVEHRTVCKRVSQQSVGLSKEFLHSIYPVAEFIYSRSIYGAHNLQTV